MSSRTGSIKPTGLSPKEYMMWRHRMLAKYGQNVFAKLGIDLPDDFEELPPSHREAFNDQVESAIYEKTKEMQSLDEDTLARKEFDFVSEDDWKTIRSGTRFENNLVRFRMFKGRNYDMEYVVSPPDIMWHIFYPGIVTAMPNVFQDMISLMSGIIPRYWKVSMTFDTRVSPYSNAIDENSRETGLVECSSYCVKFEDACNIAGAKYILQKALNNILQEFILPVHTI